MRLFRTVRPVLTASSLLLAFVANTSIVMGQTDTTFTVQSVLNENGIPANGVYDVEFILWNNEEGGTALAGPLLFDDLPVTNGAMTVDLDFGPTFFNGPPRWLEVRINGTPLSPRQLIARAPYAMQTRGLFVDENLNIGIGTSTPNERVHIIEDSAVGLLVESSTGPTAVFESSASSAFNLVACCTATTGGSAAVRGEIRSPFGAAVSGVVFELDGSASGVEGSTSADLGTGVYGKGGKYGIRGEVFGSSNYAGYFEGGRNYFEGDVGIGTTTPLTRLHVIGGIDASPSGGGYAQFGGFTNVLIDDNEIMARSGTNTAAIAINHNGGNVHILGAPGASGNVGIGTTGPGFKLHVNGSAGKPGGGSWSIASDARLKKNIEPVRGALDDLLALRGVTFEYIDPESINELPGRRIGMVAQEVERVFPDWVDERADGYKAVTFRGFEALTVEALRELHTENQLLRMRVTELEQAVARLIASQQERSE